MSIMQRVNEKNPCKFCGRVPYTVEVGGIDKYETSCTIGCWIQSKEQSVTAQARTRRGSISKWNRLNPIQPAKQTKPLESRQKCARRVSNKWLDGDCLDSILAIYDEPKCVDRYTIIYREIHDSHKGMYLVCFCCSERPCHPQGIGQHGEVSLSDLGFFRSQTAKKKIRWTDLPEDVRSCLISLEKRYEKEKENAKHKT